MASCLVLDLTRNGARCCVDSRMHARPAGLNFLGSLSLQGSVLQIEGGNRTVRSGCIPTHVV